MKNIIIVSKETVSTVRQNEDGSGLSENETKIIESGFPDNFIVIQENAYGKLAVSRLSSYEIKQRYGELPELILN
jgi:hypothetical protein